MDTTAAVASSSRPPEGSGAETLVDSYDRLALDPASQAQVLRAYQRDGMQISRLVDTTSELIRSIAGTRWLAHRQTIVDLSVQAVYLFLTFGRGSQTLGEEYTDVLPSIRRGRLTMRRRLLTCFLLLVPSILTPAALAHLRASTPSSSPPTRFTQAKTRLLALLESPIVQSLPEIHLVLFMFGGRFYEFARRLVGVRYVSTLPPNSAQTRMPSYEPLGLIMTLPILYRLFPCHLFTSPPTPSSASLNPTPRLSSLPGPNAPLTPPLTPQADDPPPLPAHSESTKHGVIANPLTYDERNTYLTPAAQELPERQCTLCLEPRGTGEGSGGTVAVTECGHVFCWGCLGGLDKPECPLCRQALRMERLVAAYNL